MGLEVSPGYSTGTLPDTFVRFQDFSWGRTLFLPPPHSLGFPRLNGNAGLVWFKPVVTAPKSVGFQRTSPLKLPCFLGCGLNERHGLIHAV
jgi:hypothetical protein